MAAHKAWRARFAFDVPGTVEITEMKLWDADFNPIAFSGGTPFGDDSVPTHEAAKAFDNNDATYLEMDGYVEPICGYIFSADVDARFAQLYSVPGSMPDGYYLEVSEDTTTGHDGTWTILTVAEHDPEGGHGGLVIHGWDDPIGSLSQGPWGYVELVFLDTNNNPNVSLAEMIVAASIGGATECSGGTPSASTTYPGSAVANLFDADPTTWWANDATNTPWFPQNVTYQFAAPVAVAELRITTRSGFNQWPNDFLIRASNDGSTWSLIRACLGNIGFSDGATFSFPIGIAVGAIVSQQIGYSLESVYPAARYSQLIGYSLESVRSPARVSQVVAYSLESISGVARVSQLIGYVLEGTEPETLITRQDRAFRRLEDQLNYTNWGLARFIDEYAPIEIGGDDMTAAPRWFDRITQADSGSELITGWWDHPLMRFTLPEAVRDQETFEAILSHWLVMGGPAHTFPFRNPLDYASCALSDDFMPLSLGPLNQAIGTGDGAKTQFQLTKRYQAGAQFYDFPIRLPVTSTVEIALNGVQLGREHWSVTRLGGIVTFLVPPGGGDAISAGFLFDHEVRFEGDDGFQGLCQSFAASGFANLTLTGVKPTYD